VRRGRKAAGADVDYPKRSVTLIVGFDPGASASISAHIFADGVRKHLARPAPFIINHKPGASGLLDADFFMKQPADGYTLLWPVEGSPQQHTRGHSHDGVRAYAHFPRGPVRRANMSW